MRSYRMALAGKGRPGRPGVLCRGALAFLSGLLVSGEDRAGGTGIGGEPVEVFVGEGLGGVAGCVDDADGAFVPEDGYGQGVRPAGVRAGLRCWRRR